MVSGGTPAVFGEVELLLAVIFVDFAAPERYISGDITTSPSCPKTSIASWYEFIFYWFNTNAILIVQFGNSYEKQWN